MKFHELIYFNRFESLFYGYVWSLKWTHATNLILVVVVVFQWKIAGIDDNLPTLICQNRSNFVCIFSNTIHHFGASCVCVSHISSNFVCFICWFFWCFFSYFFVFVFAGSIFVLWLLQRIYFILTFSICFSLINRKRKILLPNICRAIKFNEQCTNEGIEKSFSFHF